MARRFSPCAMAPCPLRAQPRHAGCCGPRRWLPTAIGETHASMPSFCATGTAGPGVGSWNGIAMELSSKHRRRIVAVFLRRLSTDRLQREPKASGTPVETRRPLVVADKIANALRLTAVDMESARLGLKPGMALADA